MAERTRLLSVKEAAGRIGVHPKTLRRWADAGLVPVVRLPNGYRKFRPEAVERLLQERTTPATPVPGSSGNSGKDETL
jgi:excisionase family DNA binding protein